MKRQLPFYILIVFFCLSTLSSCTKKEKKESWQKGDKLELKYAKGFDLYYRDGYKELFVYNPWKRDEIFARYYLVEDASLQIPKNSQKVLVPLQSIALASVTHIEFLNLLAELNSTIGACSPHLMYNSELREDKKNGKIIDLGDAFSIDMERTFLLHPDALMASGYNQEDANLLRLARGGVPVLYNNEWMETSLLGRAEWIKFVAAFYNKEAMADSIFSEIEKSYNDTKELAKKATNRPKILSGSNFRGTWYMPGGKSYMGQLFDDARAEYFYASDSTAGSLALNLETVLMNFSDARIWLNCNFNSIKELIDADKKHALFDAVKSGEVYNFNRRQLPSGANDFWESAIARPDWLLMDVVKVLHPDLLPEHTLIYTNKLK